MKTVEAKGYSKEKAFTATGLDVDLDMLKNATIAWKKEGSPMDSKKLAKFMAEYIKDKKAVGAYIVVEQASNDTRLRPYTVINEVTKGKRKATTFYQVKPAELKVKTVKTEVENEETGEVEIVETKQVTVLNTGVAEAKATKKEEAVKAMKDLTAANCCDYAIEIVKEVTEGQKYASYSIYTPSKSAKEGKFMFFISE